MDKFMGSKYIFVVGIGGSDLASKAVWRAVTQYKNPDKKIFFLESPDSREYEEVKNFINKEIANLSEMVLIVISKSGQTAETLETFHKTFDMLSEKFGQPINDRVLIISSPGTPLWDLAGQKNIERAKWQEGVGGRWSAFTIAHTSVLEIAGLQVDSFTKGGEHSEESRSAELALKIFEGYKGGRDILDFFFFNSELEDVGKWCRQLIAESLGKTNSKGEKVGLTPTVSIGPVDLHSMLQLDLGGPRNKFTIFVHSLKEIKDGINENAYKDVTAEYEKEGLAHYKYEMPEINEYEIGKFMRFMMDVTLELGKLLEVNPLDQPEVEEYKSNLGK